MLAVFTDDLLCASQPAAPPSQDHTSLWKYIRRHHGVSHCGDVMVQWGTLFISPLSQEGSMAGCPLGTVP